MSEIKSFQDLNIWKESHSLTLEIYKITNNARGSLSETIYHLILSKDLGYIKVGDFDRLYGRYDGLARGVNVFISKLKA